MRELHVDSVIKTFGTTQILTDVFVHCKEGEIIGLLGRNGSGKSTLLKIIFGSLLADRKFVRVSNKITNGVYDNRNLINYLPQDSFLPSHIKIKKIISIFCDKDNAEIIYNLEYIRPLLNKNIKQISGGENRFLQILLLVYSNAEFVLIDEPFNGVAPIYKDYIKDILIEQSKHKGIIITDHDFRNVLDIATRTILIHDGGTKEIKDSQDLVHWGYVSEI